MKRVLPLLLIPLSLWASGSQVPPATLRVLTYNIHHGEGIDGRIDLRRLADVIASTLPDIVALQEVDQGTERAGGVHQLAELERLTSLRAAFGKAMDYSSGAYGVAVLSRWPVEGASTHALPGSADREPRVALTVRVGLGAGGPALQFTSTHLDQGRDPADRLSQARRLNALLVREDEEPAILAGDMNTRSETELMDMFEGRWLDAFAAGPPATDPAGPRPRRVDYVLLRPAESWRVVESRIIDDADASDHRPILVVLEWTGKRTLVQE